MIGLDLRKIERLAREAIAENADKAWWGPSTLRNGPRMNDQDAAYVSAANPDAVVAMIVELRRLGSDLGRLDEKGVFAIAERTDARP